MGIGRHLQSPLRIVSALAAGLMSLAWGGYQYGVRVEARKLSVGRLALTVPTFLPDSAPYRIVQLTDFHLSPIVSSEHLLRGINVANELEPDLILLTGDYVGREIAEIYELAPLLATLCARHGVLGVLGNHDMFTGPAAITLALRQANVEVLQNRGKLVQTPGGPLFIAGRDDALYGTPDVPAALAGIPGGVPAIIMVHEPDIAPYVAADPRVFLQLSGHTHGGQVNLPFFGSPALPRMGRNYLRGLYEVNVMWLYVSRGLGLSHLPVRINSQPEVTEITLRGPD